VKLLVLGGTKFLGRHLVEAALDRGHEVVLFHRGQTGADLFPALEHVVGDRDGGLEGLKGRTFDAVLDTSGYVPRLVRASAELLSGSAGFYAFISSISVYPDHTPPGYDELSPTLELTDPASEDIAADYGALKAVCERIVEEVFPHSCLNVRAGLIVGPHDPTGRFTYWVARLARGGEVLAPAPAAAPVQFIDARDLAAWTVEMVARSQAGTFNATGPAGSLTFEGFLRQCADATGSDASATWVDPDFLLERGVEPWSELPLWLPGEQGHALMHADIGKALRAGLRFRPLEETVCDTWEWARQLPEAPGDAGMRREREAELLAEWREAS
jgi:nucleoside-diphosphate-sugar epimerase